MSSNLSDDAILSIITSIDNFEDLDNICKSSARYRDICKLYKIFICKSVLKNMGYTNYDGITESPCTLLLALRNFFKSVSEAISQKPKLGLSIENSIDKKEYSELVFSTDDVSRNLARFLAINKKINKKIFWEITTNLIKKNDFNKLVIFHTITDYNFSTPRDYQTIVSLAGSWADGYKDLRIFKYILDHGGKLNELDTSEYWEDTFPDEFEDIIINGGIRARDVILIVNEDDYPPLVNLINSYPDDGSYVEAEEIQTLPSYDESESESESYNEDEDEEDESESYNEDEDESESYNEDEDESESYNEDEDESESESEN